MMGIDDSTDIVRMGYVDENSESFLGDIGAHGTFLGGIIAAQRNDVGVML